MTNKPGPKPLPPEQKKVPSGYRIPQWQLDKLRGMDGAVSELIGRAVEAAYFCDLPLMSMRELQSEVDAYLAGVDISRAFAATGGAPVTVMLKGGPRNEQD